MLDNVEETFDVFGKDLVSLGRRNLSKKDKNASKGLSRSLKWETTVTKNAVQFEFFAEDYWAYVDFGVQGVGGTKSDGTQWKKKKVTRSRFQSENGLRQFKYRKKRPPARVFDSWQVRKGLAPRSAGGQFLKRSSVNFAIAESVYRTGLETTGFFSTAFERLFKELPDEVIEAYGLDMERTLQQAIDNQ